MKQERNDILVKILLAQDQVPIWIYPMKSLKYCHDLLEVKPLLSQEKTKLNILEKKKRLERENRIQRKLGLDAASCVSFSYFEVVISKDLSQNGNYFTTENLLCNYQLPNLVI